MHIKRFINAAGEEICAPIGKQSNRFFDVSLYGTTFPNPKYKLYHNPHRSHVFEYVISGRGHIEYDNKHITVEAGDFYFLRSGFVGLYYADPQEPYKKIWVNASGTMVERLADAYGVSEPAVVCRLGKPAQTLLYQLHEIFDQCAEQEIDDILHRASEKAFELLSLALGKKAVSDAYFDPSFSRMVKDYIEARLYDAPSLGHLAERFHVNPSYLIRLFKKETGMTPMKYYNTCRIKAASQMLCDGYTAKEIAATLNFTDAAYFSKCFKIETGFSPTAYLKKCGETARLQQKSRDISADS